MAPEVIRNEACSEKVDVYSYGVVLWELLTCETPYKNLDQNSIMWGVGSNKLRCVLFFVIKIDPIKPIKNLFREEELFYERAIPESFLKIPHDLVKLRIKEKN